MGLQVFLHIFLLYGLLALAHQPVVIARIDASDVVDIQGRDIPGRLNEGALVWVNRENWSTNYKFMRTLIYGAMTQDRAGINWELEKSKFVTFKKDKTVRTHDRCLTISSDQTRFYDREKADPPQYAMFWDTCQNQGANKRYQEWERIGFKEYIDITGEKHEAFQMYNPKTGLCIRGIRGAIYLEECNPAETRQLFFLHNLGSVTESGSLKHEGSGLCVTRMKKKGRSVFDLQPCLRGSFNQLFDLYENGALCMKKEDWCVKLPDLGDKYESKELTIRVQSNFLQESIMYSRPPSMCSEDGYCPFISLMGASGDCVGVRTYKNWCFGTKSTTRNQLEALKHCTGTPLERFKFV